MEDQKRISVIKYFVFFSLIVKKLKHKLKNNWFPKEFSNERRRYMKTIEYKKHFDAVIKAMEKIDSLVLSLYVLILALSKKEY